MEQQKTSVFFFGICSLLFAIRIKKCKCWYLLPTLYASYTKLLSCLYLTVKFEMMVSKNFLPLLCSISGLQHLYLKRSYYSTCVSLAAAHLLLGFTEPKWPKADWCVLFSYFACLVQINGNWSVTHRPYTVTFR